MTYEYEVRTAAGADELMTVDGNFPAEEIERAIETAVAKSKLATAPCDDQMFEFVHSMEESGISVSFSNDVPEDFTGKCIDIPVW